MRRKKLLAVDVRNTIMNFNTRESKSLLSHIALIDMIVRLSRYAAGGGRVSTTLLLLAKLSDNDLSNKLLALKDDVGELTVYVKENV